jgi:WD40 repeat protein
LDLSNKPTGPNITSNKIVTPFRERSNNLRFVSPRQMHQNAMYQGGTNDHSMSVVNSFNLSPMSLSSNQRSTLGPFADKRMRKIAKVPCKVLDAPSLQDDFYLNLVDWGSQNMLAVGLGNTVYLWHASTSQVTKLVDLSGTEDAVTSVAWSEGGRHLAVGTTRGEVQLWDATAEKLIRTMNGHSARVGSLAWKETSSGGSTLLASGSRDRLVCLRWRLVSFLLVLVKMCIDSSSCYSWGMGYRQVKKIDCFFWDLRH